MSYPQFNRNPQAKKIENLYLGRIRQFTDNGGQYHDLNLSAHYDRVRSGEGVNLEVWSVPDQQRPLFKEAMSAAKWSPTQIGENFGPSWSTHWFKVVIRVPAVWATEFKEKPLFDFDSSDEGFIYLEDGTPVVGLSGEHSRTEWILPSQWIDGEEHTFYIETACNNITGNGSPPDPNRTFRLNRADLVVPNQLARALNIDFWIIGDAAREFPTSSWQRHHARRILNRIINTFDGTDKGIARGREIAQEYIGIVDTPGIFNHNDDTQGLVYAVGNCHIDTAWLWPYAETRRKIARSWASQVDLLERYPEYVFAASQAVQFQWLKEDYPGLFSRVKKAISRGRFVPIGGSWVECDTNMPGGEALARQMILGQRFFEQEFGVRSEVFWLPDTFGYSPQLPQICRLAGMQYFLTQKLSWNNINVFPHSTFNWVGIDTSQVICHMPPANTYTAQAHFGDVKRSLEQHKNLDADHHSLMLYGHGDGGGGPTAEMIEKLRRCRGLSDTVDMLPSVRQGQTPNGFFAKVLEATDGGSTLPSWVGELYLEYHRGTYTTQAAIKWGNRRCEALLYDLEMLATAASLVSPKKYLYPFEEIDHLWELVCLNQFHDVLPGSGIQMIYEDARRIHRDVLVKGEELAKDALYALGYGPGEDNLWMVDQLPQDIAKITAHRQDEKAYLENSYLKVSFTDGKLESIYDKKADREVLTGTGNQLFLLEDQPMNFPAWDTEQYATEKRRNLHPVDWKSTSTTVETWYKFSKSQLQQTIKLNGEVVEVETKVDWHETYQFLKVEFPVDVISDHASYETQFGFHRRPTHYNTSWDAAKFEVCAHRFADLSDWEYGVALLNDCKYGYLVHGSTLQLSLLRAPKSPDATADMGTHTFKYGLLPHRGPLSPHVVKAARFFSHQPRRVRGSGISPHVVRLQGSPAIFISAVKRADGDRSSDSKSIVVRVYESMGGRAKGKLTSRLPVKRAKQVSLLEDELRDTDVLTDANGEDTIEISLRPFEVQTWLLTLQ